MTFSSSCGGCCTTDRATTVSNPDPSTQPADDPSEPDPTYLDLGDEGGDDACRKGIDSKPVVLDLSGEGGTTRPGLDQYRNSEPDPKHSRQIAFALLVIFGLGLAGIVGMTTLIAWHRSAVLPDVVAFFGTIVTMLGTLIGGVVAFYFSRRS